MVSYDERQIRFMLERLAQELYRPTRETRLEIQGLQPVVVPGQPGQEVDVPATLATILERLEQEESGTVEVVMREHRPAITDLTTAQEAIRRLLSGPVTLTRADGSLAFALDPAVLVQMMRLEGRSESGGQPVIVPTLDEAALTAVAERWAGLIAIEPRDARIDFDSNTGTFTTLVPSQIGRELDVAETVRRIQQAATGDVRIQELPVRLIPPAVDEARVNEMGIKELVAQGKSRFAGSSAARVHNIVTAAEKLRGLVIPPGGEFSFNRVVGDVTAANGFEDSLVIWGDRTAVGIGGGVCQVSTTVFRAAFFGGFPIVERWAHGYVVSWYGEPGLDATIYTPDVDFRFRNDTGHYLLVKPEVDTQRGVLTISLYGTRVDRQVEMEGPIIENRQPAPDPLYQMDSSLPPGTRKQVDWAVEGMDVTVTRVIKDSSGKVLGRDVFVSHYQPWRAVYLVGPTPEATPAPPAETQPVGE
jgi:vancomycin resistance protein YoaR